MAETRYRVFVGVTPGLEALLAAELEALPGAPRATRTTAGVELQVTQLGLWRVAHATRLGESLRVRVGRFEARSFAALEERLGRLAWSAWIAPGSAVRVYATCRRSRLYHSDAVRERALRVLGERLGCVPAGAADGGDPSAGAAQPVLVHLRLERDRVQVSVDAAGERLHRRGYRLAIGRAPLRETLAAACVARADVRPDEVLWDPFCGSGTLPIEAALRATGAPAPSAARRFAFERWPTHDRRAYRAFLAALRAEPRDAAGAGFAAIGSDVDPAAVEAARDNAERAGVSEALTIAQGDFEAVANRVPRGAHLLTNLPYGRRSRGPLADLFARFGGLLRRRPNLAAVHVLSGHPDFERASGLAWDCLLAFDNRGLAVRLLRLAPRQL